MILKEAYYYLYYKIYKAFNKHYNPLLSTEFRADISIMAIKVWFIGAISVYLATIFRIDLLGLRITNPFVILALLLIIGSTLYFFTFSDKWKSYFEKFEKWPIQKNRRGSIVVWSIVGFIFINFILSVELMRRVSG